MKTNFYTGVVLDLLLFSMSQTMDFVSYEYIIFIQMQNGDRRKNASKTEDGHWVFSPFLHSVVFVLLDPFNICEVCRFASQNNYYSHWQLFTHSRAC